MAAYVVEETNPSTATTTAEEGTISAAAEFPNIDLQDEDARIPPPNAFVLQRHPPVSRKTSMHRFITWLGLRRRTSKVVDPAVDVTATNNNTMRKQNGVLLPWSDEDTDVEEEEDDDEEGLAKCCSRKRRKKKVRNRNPDTEMDWIDDVAKVLFPTAYLLFNWIYWMVFYWLGDEIDSIPAIRDTSLHIHSATPAPISVNASA